jgi:subtilisin family serine protease
MSWIYDAVNEAEKKGILIITTVWDAGEDLAIKKYYPSKEGYKGKSYKNIMTVANSDTTGAPSAMSNYGKGGLDLYAPGQNIYSTLPGDIYKIASSSSFGAVVAAGSAAFIKAYFPELSGAEIREIFIKNCTDKRGVEVEKSIRQKDKIEKEVFMYEQLCGSAGILNLRKSVEAALKYKVKK